MKIMCPTYISRTTKYATSLGIFYFFIFFMNFMVHNVFRQSTLVNSVSSSGGDAFFSGSLLEKNIPYFVLPTHSEAKKDANTLIEYRLGQSLTSKVVFHEQRVIDFPYLIRPFSEPDFTSKGKDSNWKKTFGPQLKTIGDYFRYLWTSQADCRKVIRMGGTYQCGTEANSTNPLFGHKYICMDPPLLLAHGSSRDPRKCLTLSFGIEFDTSFDEAMSELPCEVHMYDITNYDHFLPTVVKHVYFHNEGLAGKPEIQSFEGTNKTVPKDRLRNHVHKSNLTNRLIHVLKVDIENAEWLSFIDISQDPIFDAVGQVSLEVHALDFVKGFKYQDSMSELPEDQWLQTAQGRYDILRAIEARGFRRVLYWENRQKEKWNYYDTDGTAYTSSGELLYINTNWYNSSFMEQLALRGYDFQDKRQETTDIDQ